MSYKDIRVLLVDDLALARERLRQGLLKLGFTAANVKEAANGREGFDLLKAAVAAREPFRLVLSDWNMPELSGVDLLRRCRADAELSGVKFMIVSSEGESNSVVEPIEAGADDYAVKPIGAEDLTTKLGKLLA
jgi:two-component system chemotaxis response regulator CheY